MIILDEPRAGKTGAIKSLGERVYGSRSLWSSVGKQKRKKMKNGYYHFSIVIIQINDMFKTRLVSCLSILLTYEKAKNGHGLGSQNAFHIREVPCRRLSQAMLS